MRFTNRFLAGTAVVALATGGAIVAVAGPASAATPTGGCWVYGANDSDPIESTTPVSNTSSSLAAWADPAASPVGAADYEITTSGGSVEGTTRNFTMTFNKGPKNGGPAASGTAYYYFSVNGTNLPAVSKAFSAQGGATIPGDTITGSFTIAGGGQQSVKLRKVIYAIPDFDSRVACNGQTSGVAGGVNPATTPIDTNIESAEFTAYAVATATITSITNQNVTNAARVGDVISFAASDFSGAGSGTAELCDDTGANCHATTSSFTVDGTGAGTGTITVPASFTGSKTLRLSSNGEVGLRAITILDTPTISTNVVGGGAGTVVTVTGTNWDPNKAVTIRGMFPNASYPCSPVPCGPYSNTADAAVTPTAAADGTVTTTYTVQASNTTMIAGSQRFGAGTIFGGASFTFSGDTCQAKAGAAATGECALLQTMKLTVTAGNLTTSKVAGDVVMDGVTLNGTAQHSFGDLKQVTVKDYRGGSLGWSLTAKFSGLTGPTTIGSDQLSWTPDCNADATNNDDTVTTGSSGALFTSSSTGVPVCTVLPAGLGADGASGGDTTLDAELDLSLGANQKAGNYVGTITLTLS
jgi:hypothetical protein